MNNSMSLDSVTIKVYPVNRKIFGFFGPLLPVIPVWHSPSTSRFWIILSILATNGEIWFNPGHVLLQIEQGGTYPAAGYTGPMSFSEWSKLYPVETFLDAKSFNASLNPFPVEKEEVVIGLMFDIKPLAPDQRFSMTIDGFERIGYPNVGVPMLSFKKQTRKHFDFVIFDPLSVHKEWIVD